MTRSTKCRILGAALLIGVAAIPSRAQESSPSPTPAPDFASWAKEHASIVSGAAFADGERQEFVSVAIDIDFPVKGRLFGYGNQSFFSRNRAGESVPDPTLPSSLDSLSLYSTGETTIGAYFKLDDRFAIDCFGTAIYSMSNIIGQQVGAPIDGSKFIAGCMVRVTGKVGKVALGGGHAGPVDEGLPRWGFLPSFIGRGEFKLVDRLDLLVRIESGRDVVTKKAVNASRFALRKRF